MLSKPKPITPSTLKDEYKETFDVLKKADASSQFALAKADEYQSDADQLFMRDDMISQYQVAFKYRLAADLVLLASNQEQDKLKRTLLFRRAGNLYHFAGHAFRRVEEYRWSGETYTKAGECFEKEMKEFGKGDKARFVQACESSVRAYRRSKGVYAEVGDYNPSGRAYLIEQKLVQTLLFETNPLKGILFWVWGIFSGYGESVLRWFGGYLLGLFGFAFLNALGGADVESALYVSLERSLLISNSTAGGALLVAQIAYSYFILGLGFTLVVRRMTGR